MIDKIKVVIASPSDLSDERQMIKELVNECNETKYIRQGLPIDLRMWEKSLPGANISGPQGVIDLDLEIPDADIFICMFWNKAGTVLYEDITGTEHELNIAMDSYSKSRKPDIKVFFKTADIEKQSEFDIEHIKATKQKVQLKGLYGSFNTSEELKRIVERILEDEFIKRRLPKIESKRKKDNLIYATTMNSLIENLKSNNKIFLSAGYFGVLDFESESQYAKREKAYDGEELVIEGLSNVTIIGDESVVLAKPRYANVIRFVNCNNIRLENLVFGHTPHKGYCLGGVLAFENCKNMNLSNLSLFGCGTYGIIAEDSENIIVSGTRIFECTYGGIDVSSTEITIENSMIYDCRDVYRLIIGTNESTVMLENVSIYNNTVNGYVFDMDESWLLCRGVSVYDNTYLELSNNNIPYGVMTEDNIIQEREK